MYEELLRIMPQVEVTALVAKIFSAVPLKDSAHPLSPAKLTALHKLVNSSIFQHSGTKFLMNICIFAILSKPYIWLSCYRFKKNNTARSLQTYSAPFRSSRGIEIVHRRTWRYSHILVFHAKGKDL